MTTFVDLADATLAAGTMPRVVPQLKSITLGGAVAGVGIEASSFRHGLVHDTIAAIDVLTGDGRIVVCTPDNEHRDLFHRLAEFVRHARLRAEADGAYDAGQALRARRASSDSATPPRFSPSSAELLRRPGDRLSRWRRVRPAMRWSLIAGPLRRRRPLRQRLHVRAHLLSVAARTRRADYLTARDYLWRWDTDWFWCSQNLGAQHPLLRRLSAAAGSTRSSTRRSCAGTAAGR